MQPSLVVVYLASNHRYDLKMKYQLVLQFGAALLEDFDRLVALEDHLLAKAKGCAKLPAQIYDYERKDIVLAQDALLRAIAAKIEPLRAAGLNIQIP